jgi:diguanylate cyclase (GGDEF)-like protein
MIDVDQFKRYNDHYGHLAGDAALRLVADTLPKALRPMDLAARYGGEEFVLMLPNTDLAGTCEVAERTCNAIAALNEAHAASEQGILTISIGVTAFVPTPDASVEQYLEIADAALYEAKRRGRNQVVA